MALQHMHYLISVSGASMPSNAMEASCSDLYAYFLSCLLRRGRMVFHMAMQISCTNTPSDVGPSLYDVVKGSTVQCSEGKNSAVQ